MSEVLEFLKSPYFYGALIAFVAALRGVGEFFEYIGKLREGKDWFDKAGGKILWIVEMIGKLITFIGIGNKQRGIEEKEE